ncbi:MAG: hypothetical protein DRI34_14830 [Deltaproteobacteria bacterium]|nr:MAG: hypothetical protein DRI34_14830 [Deltaproteobacteria bacterium]
MNVMKTVEVSILGQRLKVRTDEGTEYIKDLAAFVDEKLGEVKKKTRAVSTHSLAMLAALNIADELFKARERQQQVKAEMKERVDKILKLVRSGL